MSDIHVRHNDPPEEIFPEERLDSGEREQRRAEYRRMGPVGYWRWWIKHEKSLSFKEWIVARTYREWVLSAFPGDDLAADWFTMEPGFFATWEYDYETKKARYQGVYRIGCLKISDLTHADGSPTNCRRVFVICGDTMWEKYPAEFFDHEGPGTWVSHNDYGTWFTGESFARSMLQDLLSYQERQRQHRIDFIEL